MTSSRGFHSHVEILNLKPSTKQLGLQLNPWLNHIDTRSRSQSLGRNTERYTSYPQITDHYITSFLVTSGLTSDLPDIQSRYFYRVGSSHDSKWSEAATWVGMHMRQCGANLSARIMNPCHNLWPSLFLSVVVKMFILDMLYLCPLDQDPLDPQKLCEETQKQQVTSPIIASPVVTSKGVEFYFSLHGSRCKLFHGSLW